MTDREVLCEEFKNFKPPDDWNSGCVKSKRIQGVCVHMPTDCSTVTPQYRCEMYETCSGMSYKGKLIVLE